MMDEHEIHERCGVCCTRMGYRALGCVVCVFCTNERRVIPIPYSEWWS